MSINFVKCIFFKSRQQTKIKSHIPDLVTFPYLSIDSVYTLTSNCTIYLAESID